MQMWKMEETWISTLTFLFFPPVPPFFSSCSFFFPSFCSFFLFLFSISASLYKVNSFVLPSVQMFKSQVVRETVRMLVRLLSQKSGILLFLLWNSFFSLLARRLFFLSIFRCAVASLYEVVSVRRSVRRSVPCYFWRWKVRILGASCAVYPALFPILSVSPLVLNLTMDLLKRWRLSDLTFPGFFHPLISLSFVLLFTFPNLGEVTFKSRNLSSNHVTTWRRSSNLNAHWSPGEPQITATGLHSDHLCLNLHTLAFFYFRPHVGAWNDLVNRQLCLLDGLFLIRTWWFVFFFS